MTLEFDYVGKFPTATAQHRKHKLNGRSYLEPAEARAKAWWQAFFEKYSNGVHFGKGVPVVLVMRLHFYKRGISKIMPKTTRPDIDNLEKFILDGIQAAGIVHDDAQIFKLRLTKWYAPEAGVNVVITDEWRQFYD